MAASAEQDNRRGSLGRTQTHHVEIADGERPFRLDRGARLAPVEVAYETYGELDEGAGNCVVICHALTGDAHAAGHHGDPARRGWWDTLIGPGKPVDTDRYFVVASNLLGGCRGTTGPSSVDPATGAPYGLRFPMFTVRDLVEVQRALLERLGVRRPLAAIGGSLGGMQALQWAIDHPDELGAALIVCASSRLSAQNIGFSAVARHAIMNDPDFQGGDYYGTGRRPAHGLATARMMAHITYLSAESMRTKFDRRLREGRSPHSMEPSYEVETYLRHQGEVFLERFDPNSYLYLSRVMDYFEPFAEVDVAARLRGSPTRFLVVSFDSDWRFGTSHSRPIASELAAAGTNVRDVEVASRWGHDSFLLDVPEYHRIVAEHLTEALAARLS